MMFCNLLLQKANFPSLIAYENTMPNGQKSHFIMYCFLRAHLRRHVAKGNTHPQLSLLTKPLEYKRKEVYLGVSEMKIEFPDEDEDDLTDSSIDNNDDNSD